MQPVTTVAFSPLFFIFYFYQSLLFYLQVTVWFIFDLSPYSASGIGLSLVVVCVVVFLLCRYKQKRSPLGFLSRNISDQYHISYQEGGSVYFGVHVFAYRDLEEATNFFDSKNELGDGGFGTVYHGK